MEEREARKAARASLVRDGSEDEGVVVEGELGFEDDILKKLFGN